MEFNKSIVINVLNALGIQHNPNRVNKGWMLIKCPLHTDRHMKNAGVHLTTGIISCFACNQSTNLIKFYMERNRCSYKEAINQIFNGSMTSWSPPKAQKKEEEPTPNLKFSIDDYVTVPFNPTKYFYTSIRGYTDSFCKQFGIVHCLSDKYSDYYLLPVIDKKKDIRVFEARKLLQREKIIKYFKRLPTAITPEEFFAQCVDINNWQCEFDYVVDGLGNKNYNPTLYYLNRPKVLYPSGSALKKTLFNIDNLDFNSDLWVSEGSATLPKLYSSVSTNCTCLFGAKVTDEQIEYLKMFKKRIIIIPDNDAAAYSMIQKLNSEMNNIFVVDIKTEDTDRRFVGDIKNGSIISASSFLLHYSTQFLK